MMVLIELLKKIVFAFRPPVNPIGKELEMWISVCEHALKNLSKKK